MSRPARPRIGFTRRITLAATALRWWGPRQWIIAALGALGIGVLLGVATVLIPNDFFSRDIAPTAWDRPVWIATSLLSGLLVGSYVSPRGAAPAPEDSSADGGSRWGLAGGLLAWFAIGCPVCNKIALLALGYSGAMAYFAPLQPWMAALALVMTFGAVIYRLSGQVECPVSIPRPDALQETAERTQA
ncbi:MAG: hypothetical protein L0J68_12725 [Micrococcaceae bacterium]|uniref:hypothetical protein n=1 Tax=Arthrobacter sp. 179 TaxID=3457734 RepID=UPI00264BCBA9|nr:hypothetical protein [Micrococcaceae bacterium]MDN5813932.1 hypothetical protein [Micrococcaceae bacterium]MDN5824823.1 hypothetical protein [Micrococcaceae bacterium]MDN5904988.1 hypothetical protein [Micrococcaceae bacterium]MDN6301112.1 hypothetical protein [Micrococcaceae bacterium]